MSDALSFAELDGQHGELLPARTVLSMFTQGAHDGNASHGSGLVSNVMDLLHGNSTGANGSNADGNTGSENG
jgi:hypothetical protein